MHEVCDLFDGEKQDNRSMINLDVKFLRGLSDGKFLKKGRYVRANTYMILVDGEKDVYKIQLNMLFAIRTIQERSGKDLGATFLSGTTISNSLTELYLLFKYLRPQALEKQGINSFDAVSYTHLDVYKRQYIR